MLQTVRNRFLLFFFLLSLAGSFPAKAQFVSDPKFGFQAGIVLDFGTHVRALGITIGGYYSDFFYQWNVSSQLKYHFHSYGDRRRFWESRNAFGLVLLGGKRNLTPDFQFDGLNHQTSFSNGIAYNYLWYFDNTGTSQRSGGFGLHLRYFSLLMENDVFGGQGKDRFRTGTTQISWRYSDWKFFTNLYIWTGETAHSSWDRTPSERCPNGFRSLDQLLYGKTSHGIWSFGVTRNLVYNQYATFRAGVDSEQIRHIFQNRLMHDLVWLPAGIERHTPHYPRLDECGMPTFDRSQVRKDRFHLQLSLNEYWSN